jgi:hypothetical protein
MDPDRRRLTFSGGDQPRRRDEPFAGKSLHGAAMESNHPSVGLPRPAGFEDQVCGLRPDQCRNRYEIARRIRLAGLYPRDNNRNPLHFGIGVAAEVPRGRQWLQVARAVRGPAAKLVAPGLR